VRLKRYLEMRGSDNVPWQQLPSLPAFWVGLLYDDESLDAAWEIAKRWTAHERQALRDDVPRLGFKAKIGNRYLFEVARDCLALAHKGLSRRGRIDHWAAMRRGIWSRSIRSWKRDARQRSDCSRSSTALGPSVDPAYTEYAF
jgi:glutamate--cysteine ligase